MSNQVAQFVAGLKSRNVDVQIKTARELYHYAKTELREVPQEELTQFLDEFNHQIFEMVSSNDVHEKKGGVLAIGIHNPYFFIIIRVYNSFIYLEYIKIFTFSILFP